MKKLLLVSALLLVGCGPGMTDSEKIYWTASRVKMLANEELPPIVAKIDLVNEKLDYIQKIIDYQLNTGSGSIYDEWNRQVDLQIQCRDHYAEEKIKEENRMGVKGLPIWHEYTAMFEDKCKQAHPLPILP